MACNALQQHWTTVRAVASSVSALNGAAETGICLAAKVGMREKERSDSL